MKGMKLLNLKNATKTPKHKGSQSEESKQSFLSATLSLCAFVAK